MYRLALRITLNSQEAEDIVQDVIIKLWKAQSPPQSPLQGEASVVSNLTIDKLSAYALRMTRNLALDRQRLKINQTKNIDGMDFSSGSSIEHDMEQQERIQSVRKAMELLPEKQRTCMQLRDFEGYTYKEISNIMEISEEQVKVNIFRARQFVKENLLLET